MLLVWYYFYKNIKERPYIEIFTLLSCWKGPFWLGTFKLLLIEINDVQSRLTVLYKKEFNSFQNSLQRTLNSIDTAQICSISLGNKTIFEYRKTKNNKSFLIFWKYNNVNKVICNFPNTCHRRKKKFNKQAILILMQIK